MKILVYGAGVIGSLYGARLQEGGHHVTVLARGVRLADIRLHGLVLEEVTTGTQSITQVATTERLGIEDRYDVVLITVRRDQLAGVMAELIANRHVPVFLFMLNNPLGSAELAKALGSDRVLLGFPGAGGTRAGHIVRYAMIAQQPTTLGEPSGRRTQRLSSIVKAFRDSGFRTRTDRNMDAWLKAHAFLVTAITGAIYLADGDCRRLSGDSTVLRLMTNGVREGFAVVRALGLTVTPFSLRVLFTWLPRRFAMRYWRRFFAAEMADYVFGRHARTAFNEIREIANDCRILMERSRVDVPALRQLYSAIDAYTGP